jgi:molybdopterin-binding protein
MAASGSPVWLFDVANTMLPIKESAMRLSARNKIPARVTAITHGEATANVELDAAGVRLVAAITTEAARELGLSKGDQVVAMIKASDVILAVED